METYCLSYKKNTSNRNSSIRRTKQNRLMLLMARKSRGLKKSSQELHQVVFNNFNNI